MENRGEYLLQQFTSLTAGAVLPLVEWGKDIPDNAQLECLVFEYTLNLANGVTSSFDFNSEANLESFLEALAPVGGIWLESATVGTLISKTLSLHDLVMILRKNGKWPLSGWPFATYGQTISTTSAGNMIMKLRVEIDFAQEHRPPIAWQHAPFVPQLTEGGLHLTVGTLSATIDALTWTITGDLSVIARVRTAKPTKISPLRFDAITLNLETVMKVFTGPNLVLYAGVADVTPATLLAAGAGNVRRVVDGVEIPGGERFTPARETQYMIDQYEDEDVTERPRVIGATGGWSPDYNDEGLPFFWSGEKSTLEEYTTVERAAVVDLTLAGSGYASALGSSCRFLRFYVTPTSSVKDVKGCSCTPGGPVGAVAPRGWDPKTLTVRKPQIIPFLPLTDSGPYLPPKTNS